MPARYGGAYARCYDTQMRMSYTRDDFDFRRESLYGG